MEKFNLSIYNVPYHFHDCDNHIDAIIGISFRSGFRTS